MNPTDQTDFLKRPRLDMGGRHKKKRIEIAERWATAQDQEVAEPLTVVARDRQDDYDVRLAAVQALGAVGAGQAVSTLAAILADRAESGLHSVAITALANIGNDQAVGALIGAWEQVKALRRDDIRQALIRLRPERTVEPLIETLGHSSPTVREQATTALRQFEGIVPSLVAALGHEDAKVRDGARVLLIQTGAPAVPDLLTALEQADDQVREDVSETLAQIGEPAIEGLVPVASGEDAGAAKAAADALVKIGKPAVGPLIAISVSHPQAVATLLRMKKAAALVLQDASVDDVPLLITALGFADDDLRQSASEGLVKIGEPAVPGLLALLAGDDGRQARAADEILVEMGEQAIQTLVGSLDDAELGQKATGLVLRVGEPALPVLFQRLCEPDCTDRDSVVEMMCAINGTDRLTLAQNQYRERIPFLLPYAKYERTTKLLLGEASFQEQMSWEDGSEELNSQAELYRHEKYQDVQTGIWHDGDQVPDPAQVIPQLQAIATIAPKFALPHYWIGQWYLINLCDVEKAIRSFEQATHCQEYVYEDRQAKSYWWLGVSYGTPSPHFDYEKSQNCFERTIDLGWDEPLVYQAIQASAQVVMEQCLEEGQNPDLFLSAMRKKTGALCAFVERDPDREDAKEHLESSQSTLDRIEKDYARLGELAAFAEIRGNLLVDRAFALSQDDQDEKAIDLLRKLLQEQPDNEQANSALRNILLSSGRVQEGIKQLKQSLPQEPGPQFFTSRANLFNLISTCLPLIDQTLDRMISLGRYLEALMLLNDLETLFSPTAEIREAPGGLLERFAGMLNRIGFRYSKVAQASGILEAHASAVRCIETAFSLSHDPYIIQNLPLVHRDVAEHLASQGQWGQAIAHLQRAVEVNPEFGDGWWRLSVAYIQLQDMESSMACLLRAAALGDEDAIAAMARLSRR